MRFVDEFRDPAAARALVKSITKLAGEGRFKFMEVCGGHTHTIYRLGIEHLLREAVELVHGPGCPVCVIPMGRVDDAMWLAEQPGIIFTNFGDMMRVPGSNGNLIEAKLVGRRAIRVFPAGRAEGGARQPGPSHRVLRCRFRNHRTVDRRHSGTRAQPRRAQFHCILQPRHHRPADQGHPRNPDLRPTAFWGPVTSPRSLGCGPTGSCRQCMESPWWWLDLSRASVHMLLRQICDGRCEVENQYTRVVQPEGNTQALKLAETFELRPHFEWRPGLHLAERTQDSPRLCGLRRRTETRSARRARRGPESVQVRRGAQRRHQTVRVQGLRHRLHPRDTDRHVHGLPGRRLRGLLQLRPATPRDRAVTRPGGLKPSRGYRQAWAGEFLLQPRMDGRVTDVTIAMKGGDMPLSDHEQRMLDGIERELQNEDPKLAQNLRASSWTIRRRLKAAALLVGGWATMLSAIILVPTVVPVLLIASVIGFLLTLAGAVYLITAPRGRGA
jgi:hydrogenase expression/formation protein HypD